MQTDAHQDSLDILHTGDIVTLKVSLSSDPYGEAGQGEDDTGYVTADGIRGEVSLVPCDTVEGTGLDIREFLFVVVDQLSYIALRDLKRRKKHLLSDSGQLRGSALAQLQNYEQRADAEAEQNDELRRTQRKPLYYGDVVQLLHLRTGRFMGVRAKTPAPLQRTSRRVDLQQGNTSSWLKLNPYFSHKLQGQPIAIGEQVSMQCMKLGKDWCINWVTADDATGTHIREVNCAPKGRGFYFNLYSRSVPCTVGSKNLALSFGLTICLFHPHSGGFISGSSAQHKRKPYLRMQPSTQSGRSSKSVWVIEHVTHELKDQGIMWLQTPVYLRHFGSGRYLAVSSEDLRAKFPQEELSDGALSSSGRRSFTTKMLLGAGMGLKELNCELVDLPGPNCVFTLESTSSMKVGDPGEKNFVSREAETCLMLRWEKPPELIPFWLSCSGVPKGTRGSMELSFSSIRQSRDAIRLDVIQSEDPWMLECDVVAEHSTKLRRSIIPLCSNLADPKAACAICGVTAHMICDMIFFLSGSSNWRSVDTSDLKQPDGLDEIWIAKPERQQLARELKYINSSFDLFNEFVKQTPSLSTGDINFASREDALTSVASREMNESLGIVQHAAALKTRCLKLLVRLWVFCFLNNGENEEYFDKNGWVKVINNLNGHGLGASGVFVSLVSDNPKLIRSVDRTTMLKFIGFIRQLGPMDTWLQFLAALCAPRGIAMFLKQQDVLCNLVFAGERAKEEERAIAAQNRDDLLIAVRLGSPTGRYLGPPTAGSTPPPLEECMAYNLLTEGIHDIAISWAHPEHWNVGDSVLYHGPDVLMLPRAPTPRDEPEGKAWVSLAQVVWVLQPEPCCERTLGISWQEAQQQDGIPSARSPGARSTADSTLDDDRHKRSSQWNITGLTGSMIDHKRVLAKYFLAQLQLICGMVRERQMNCILALQHEYSFALCLSGASDERLPTSIRAAFMDIMLALWVDRHPHFQVVMPSLLRHLPHLQGNRLDELPTFLLAQEETPDSWSPEHFRSLPDDVLSYYRLSKPHKMEALIRVLRQYLCAGFAVEQQIHSAFEDNELTNSMLKALTHVLRYGFLYSKAHILELVGPLMRMLDGRSDLLVPLSERRGSKRRPSGGPPVTNAAIMADPFTPLLQAHEQELQMYPMTSEYREFTVDYFPPLEDSMERYPDSPANKSINESKARMLEVILQMMQARDHIRISRILDTAKEFLDEHAPMSAGASDSLVTSILRVLQDPVIGLKGPRISSPDVMCVDLMMYEDPRLFSLAFELLYQDYMQTLGILNQLESVVILNSRQLELFDVLKVDVATLGKLIYSFENWGVEDMFSIVDNQKFQLFQRICLKIRNLCHLGDASTRPAEVQHMLRETELWPHIKYVICLQPIDFTQTCHGLLARVVALVCSVAAQFVSGNAENQVTAVSALEQIRKLLSTHPDSALLAAEIFRGNFDLCHQVSKDLIMQFGDLVVRERQQGKFVPWYLTFFRSVCIAANTPVPANQAMVLQELLRVGPENALHLLQNDSGPHHIQRLAQGFRSVGQLTNPEVSRGTVGDDAELIYYIRSLELVVAVASGFGVQSIMCKPFASRVFAPEMAFRLLLHFGNKSDKTDNQFSVHRYLKIRWLQFLQAVVYDVDKSLIDLELLIGMLHVEFFTRMLQWVQAVLRPSHGHGERSTIDADEEEYLHMMLSCIESFFRNCYALIISCSHDTGSGELKTLALNYQQRLSPMLKSNTSFVAHVGLRDPQVLYAAVAQINTSVNSPGKDSHRRLSTSCIRSVPTVPTPGVQLHWRTVIEKLRHDPLIEECIKREEDKLGQIFSNITQMTDPELPEYLRQVPHELGRGLPDGVDFRRGQITTEDALKRMVKHIETRVMTDLAGVRRIELVLQVMMRLAREKSAKGDRHALPLCHSQFAGSGVTDLIIRILDANPAEDITATAWSLLSQFLQGRDGVNVEVQKAILESCLKGDDSGMWETFAQFLNDVSSQTKTSRNLKVANFLSAEEQLVMAEYEESIDNSMKAMEAVRLLVEGHYFPMQQYLFKQTGNKYSHNVPEVAALLFIRMCKDQYAVDILSEIEMDCISCTLNLLIELAQGPNVRNQEYLSTLGLIETVFKVLAANFDRFRTKAGDVYPPAVRRLKALGVGTLLTLLEGRLDTKIQHTMLQRSDSRVLRDRLEFVYVYFVCGAFDVGRGRTQTDRNAAIPLDTDTARLVHDRGDSPKLYEHLVIASPVAEELLEDLDDLELDELFSEGLDVLALIFQLCPHSPEFERLVTPLDKNKETFKHSREFYVTEREFLRERVAFQAREIYRFSYDFLSRFVKTIEVMLNGKLQPLHFQRPLTEMWYVHGQAKNHIQNSVPLGSSDTKMKSFIAMCQKAHAESKLVRRLSRFTIMPNRYAKWAQRNLWDGVHRPFQTFFKNDAKNMSRSLTLQLILGLALSLHAGSSLVPLAHIAKEERADIEYTLSDGLDWSSVLMERIAFTMGCLYVAVVIVWLIVTFCLKAPLKFEDIMAESLHKAQFRVVLQASYETLISPMIAWRIVLLFSCTLCICLKQYWLYSFLVADFFCQNASLGNVLEAIVNKGYSLSMTFLGAVLITYVYAGFAFHYFREDFHSHCNENVLFCCANIIYQGTRNGIVGLSGMMDEVMPHDPKFFIRVVFDVSYFIVFGIMLLNTIVALIVDSFSALRMETEARDHNNETQTFISCIDRKVIETVAQAAGIADGWDYHETKKQNKWDYMAFIFHLGEKNAEDYTGPEQSIREMIENKDVKWLPISRSMMLEADEEHGAKEDILVRIEKNTTSTIGQLSTAKEHRAMMTRAVNTLRSHVDERFDTCDEELAQIHAGIQKRRHDQTKANLAMLQAERGGQGTSAFVTSLTGIPPPASSNF